MKYFSHDIADQVESIFPVYVTSWGVQQAPAIAVNDEIDEDDETRIIHEVASWMREQGFVDIRFDTGHDQTEGKPVIVIRHPWKPGQETGTADYTADDITNMIKEGKSEDAIKMIISQKNENEPPPPIALEDLDDALNDCSESLADALSRLDETVFIIGEYDARGQLSKEVSDLAAQLTTLVDEMSEKSLKIQEIANQIDVIIP